MIMMTRPFVQVLMTVLLIGGAAALSGAPMDAQAVAPAPLPAAAAGQAGTSRAGTSQAGTSQASTSQASAKAGKVAGTVLDSDGLPIPDAVVKVVNTADNSVHEAKSDGEGKYEVADLPAGTYRVEVTVAGFDPNTVQGVVVAAGQSAAVNSKMAVATAKGETISVEAASGAAVETGTATISTTLEAKEITSYGFNGRSVTQILSLSPGVSDQSGKDEAKVGLQGSAKFSVNGGRVEYNTFEVDGADVLNSSINASRGQGLPLMVYASLDAVQEFKVTTSNYSALFGKTASGTVQITTKSGGPDFHGNVYAFIRNEKFNARNYFDAPGRTPLYRRQDYGGTIGGPIYFPGRFNPAKDKMFFFFSEELRLEKTPVAYNQAVPTVAERAGDFRDVCGGLAAVPPYGATQSIRVNRFPDCPLAGAAVNGVGQSFPGYQANVGYTSAALLSTGIIPLPNSVIGCNTTNPSPFNKCYVTSVSPSTYWREELFRIDRVLPLGQTLGFRYIHDAWNTTTLTPQWGVVQNSFPTVENKLTGPGLSLVLSVAGTLPHGFLNRAVASYTVQHITLTPQLGPGVASLQRPAILDASCALVTGATPTPPGPGAVPQQLNECPIGYIFNNGFNGGRAPGLVFQGNNGAYGGHGFNADTGYAPWNQTNPTYSLRDDVSKVIGKHSLQFGVEATYAQQNELSAVNGANSGDQQGLLTFSNQQSRYTTNNAFADFLAGPGIQPLVAVPGGGGLTRAGGYAGTAIKSFQQDSGQSKYYNRYKVAELYLQDDWKVLSHLTVSVGIRASLFGTWYNKENTAYNWQSSAYNQGLGASVYVDPTNGYLVRSTGGAGGALPTVPLNPANLDPVITNGLVHCGVNGVSNTCQDGHTFNPAPRVGVAWDPFGNGKTSIRAGYGLFWEHGTSFESNVGSLIGGAPRILSETQTFPSAGPNPAPGSPTVAGAYNRIGFSCQDDVAHGTSSQCGGTTYPGGVTFPLAVTSIPTKTVYPYAQQWSLSVERELRKDLVGTFAYVGSKGTHLTAERNLNQLQPVGAGVNPFPAGVPLTANTCSAGALRGSFPINGIPGTPASPGVGPNQPGFVNTYIACTGNPGFKDASGNSLGISADANRPYSGFSNILSVENIADSSYEAFQSTIRRTKGTLTVGASYTYSHSIDDSSDRASGNFADGLNLHANRASSDFDQRHLLSISYVYDLPLVRLINAFTHFIPSAEPGSEAAGAPPAVVTTGATPGWEDAPVWKNLLVGWQLSGVTAFQTGSPFSVINAGGTDGTGTADNAGVGNGLGLGSYADVVGNAKGLKPSVAADGSTIGPLLLNPGAFAAPRGLTFGNSGRNFLNNPSRLNFNAALLKHWKVFNERDLEFRAEGFNIFNHTQFRIYDPSHPGNTGNNVVSCYGDVSQGYNAAARRLSTDSGTQNECVTGNSFLHPVDAHDPRILQFGLKLAF